MATQLTKAVIRKTDDGFMVRIAPEGIYIRRQRRRKWFGPLTYSHLELTLGKLEADAARAAKPRRRRVSRVHL